MQAGSSSIWGQLKLEPAGVLLIRIRGSTSFSWNQTPASFVTGDMRRFSSANRTVNWGANAISHAFDAYQAMFKKITGRAQARFEGRDREGMQGNTLETMNLYESALAGVMSNIRLLVGERIQDEFLWANIKAIYSHLIAERKDRELAQTSFNCLTRQACGTIGVNPQIEFLSTQSNVPLIQASILLYCNYDETGSTAALVETILRDYPFAVPYEDIGRDARLVSDKVEVCIASMGEDRLVHAEMVRAVLYAQSGIFYPIP